MSSEQIPPTELSVKNIKYPSMEEIVKKIHGFTENVVVVETARLAKEAGSSLTQNIVLIGALAASEKLPVKNETLVNALKELVPAEHVEMNVKAFKLGYDSMKKGQRKA
jgi:indolepyruvate ferredoxin oxidoreductase beta subunit